MVVRGSRSAWGRSCGDYGGEFVVGAFVAGAQLSEDYFRRPSPARVWNYWSGGKDYYPVDQQVGDAMLETYPGILTMAAQSRKFLIRAVGFLAAQAGVGQFLDIGCGLPATQNTHEVAQADRPDAKIVYVDNDPVVLAHGRALLTSITPEGVTALLSADYQDTDAVITQARRTLDFNRPIAVMFMGVFGYLPEFDDMRTIVGRVVDAVPPGSYLVLWDGTDTSEAIRAGHEKPAELGHPYQLRSVEQITRCFDGLELVDPGVVQLSRWRPYLPDSIAPENVDAYGAVARKPS
jgi:hypothetical protein